jgi:hypothetical protein
MVGHDGVLESHFPQRHLLIRVRHLLQIMMPGHQRVEKPLRRSGLQQMQNDLRVLGIILVPRVVQRIAGAGDGQRRHLAQLKTGLP